MEPLPRTIDFARKPMAPLDNIHLPSHPSLARFAQQEMASGSAVPFAKSASLSEPSGEAPLIQRTLSAALLNAHNNSTTLDNEHITSLGSMRVSARLSVSNCENSSEHVDIHDSHVLVENAAAKTPGSLRVVSSSSGHHEVGSDGVRMPPISVCHISYENSSTGTELSSITSPPGNCSAPIRSSEARPVPPLRLNPSNKVQSLCAPSCPKDPPEPASSTTRPQQPAPGPPQLANSDMDPHTARMQLRTLMRLRQRTIQRLQALRNSIPEDSPVDFFNVNSFYDAPIPHWRSRSAGLLSINPASSVPQPNPASSQPDCCPPPCPLPCTASVRPPAANADNAQVLVATTPTNAPTPETQVIGSTGNLAFPVKHAQVQAQNSPPSTKPVSAKWEAENGAAADSSAAQIDLAAFRKGQDVPVPTPRLLQHSTEQAAHVAVRSTSQPTVMPQALEKAVMKAAQRALRDAAERAAQHGTESLLRVDQPAVSIPTRADCTASSTAMHSPSSKGATENALPYEGHSHVHEGLPSTQGDQSQSRDKVSTARSSSLGSAYTQSLGESLAVSLYSDALIDDVAQNGNVGRAQPPEMPKSLLRMQLMLPTQQFLADQAAEVNDSTSFDSRVQEFVDSAPLNGRREELQKSPLASVSHAPSTSFEHSTPMQPCFPQGSEASPSPCNGFSPLRPCLPEGSVAFTECGTPSSCMSPQALQGISSHTFHAQYQGQNACSFGASSFLSDGGLGQQSFQSQSQLLASVASGTSDLQAPIPAPEEGSEFCRFMAVMGERRNSVDLPPTRPGEEWSSAMPPSSSCGGLSSLASPVSKWGSQKLLDASPKALGCS